jgi:membrane associated rhomboid family serine protease
MFVLPICKDNPVKNPPWVVFGLIALNTLALVATYVFFSPEILFREYGFTPAHPHVSTLFFSMFLHAGFWHLAGNMWFLWMFGNRVENMFTPWLFLPAYLACGAGAAGLHYAFNSSSVIPCVGASGAISGIVGIYFVLFPKAKFDLEFYFGWIRLGGMDATTHAAVGVWLAEQTLLGVLTQFIHVSSVAFWAHVGGFASGIFIGTIFALIVPAKRRRMAERAKPWYERDRFNQEEEHLTQLKL